jgi:ABC-type Fe3+-hydroxamate transport system substrate-binding protein
MPITAERNKIIYNAVTKYLGIERRAGKTKFKTSYQPYNEMLDEAGFEKIAEQILDKTMTRNIDETPGYIFSTSWGNKHQLGDKADEFEEELKQKLLKLNPDGIFQERVIFSLLTAKKH